MSGSRVQPINPLAVAGTVVGAAVGVAALVDAYRLYSNQGSFVSGLQDPEPIQFPADLLRNGTQVPYMSLQFERYQRRSINEQPFYTEEMRIRLPIPENLLERTSVQYQTEELGSAIGSITEAALGASTIGGSLQDIVTNIGQRVTTAATGIGTSALRTAAGDIFGPNMANQGAAALSALSGISANPFQVVLFKSPQFRTHTFTWVFIPNSNEESDILKRLITTFKYHSLPGISSAGAVFFSYPEILKINFRPSDQYLYKFKPCVVDSVTVNYAPNSPSFVRSSGAPTAIKFTIQLQEIEIMTKADFLRDSAGRFSFTRALNTPTGQIPSNFAE